MRIKCLNKEGVDAKIVTKHKSLNIQGILPSF